MPTLSDLQILLIILLTILSLSIVLLWRILRPRYLQWRGVETKDLSQQPNLTIEQPLQPPLRTVGSLEQNGNRRSAWIGTILFILALSAYVLTRFVDLGSFPITFFADEAAPTVLAAELVENGFRHEGAILPTYFLNVDKYSLSVTVYMQLIPYLVFGKSVLVTRTVSVLAGLVGVLCICLMLKEIFRISLWWSGVVWVMLSPAWFYHSRTALEAPVASALFASFLLAYLLYLYRSPRVFPLVVITAALSFYAYNPARVVIVASILLMAISDRRYHWSNRKIIRGNWWVILLCLLPYVRFFFQHPLAASDQLLLLNSYWIQEINLGQKLLRFLGELLRGLNPFYWYFPHEQDLARHTMKGYGHILWIGLPFALWGIYQAFKRRDVNAYRVLLIALISAPLGGALVQTVITRALMMVVPLTLFTATGFSNLAHRLLQNRRAYVIAAFSLLLVGSGIGSVMMFDAIRNGPRWYQDYGLYGMQYGSPQVFEEINKQLERAPDSRVIVTPYWANGTTMLARFFMSDLDRLWWGVASELLEEDVDFGRQDLFVMLPAEYEQVIANERLRSIELEEILYLPDGKPGFYFARLDTAAGTDEPVVP